MSRNELEHAYREGQLSRRKFIKGMTALGVSIAAANRLADQVLASDSSAASHAHKYVDDVYDGDHKPEPPAKDDHKPQAQATGGQSAAPVTSLPSTGSGNEADTTIRSRVLGLMSASAAVAALGLQRLRKTSEETE